MKKTKLPQMHNVGIVVNDLKAAIAFFAELGLELEGETAVEGKWVDRLIALNGVRSDIAMMRTPDGHNRLELSKFQRPMATSVQLNAPVNTLGMGRIMFAVKDLKEVLTRLKAHGAELVGEIVQYEDIYLLCYIRGPEGILIALAEPLRESNENAFRTTNVTEQVYVFVLNYLSNEFSTVGLQTGKDFFEILNGEHDAAHTQRVHRCIQLDAGRHRPLELRQLKSIVAVRSSHHCDVASDTIERD